MREGWRESGFFQKNEFLLLILCHNDKNSLGFGVLSLGLEVGGWSFVCGKLVALFLKIIKM